LFVAEQDVKNKTILTLMYSPFSGLHFPFWIAAIPAAVRYDPTEVVKAGAEADLLSSTLQSLSVRRKLLKQKHLSLLI
jgi:hypothetical protein